MPEGSRIDELAQSLRLFALLLRFNAAALGVQPERGDPILDILPVSRADAVRIEPRRFPLADQGLGLRFALFQAPRTEYAHARRVARERDRRLSRGLPRIADHRGTGLVGIRVTAWVAPTRRSVTATRLSLFVLVGR